MSPDTELAKRPPKGADLPCAMMLTKNMFRRAVDDQTEVRLIDLDHAAELFKLFEANRQYLRRWHPWVDHLNSVPAVERAITSWQQLYSDKLACHAGVWFKGRLCGMVSYLNVDPTNRWTPLCYWLDEAHQGQGIMTACCRAMVAHGFAAWGFNRIAIECASENTRSRAIPERLGFKFEGIIRGIQWLHDRFVDAAMYGMLRSDFEKSHSSNRSVWAGSAGAGGQRELILPTPDCRAHLPPVASRIAGNA
jgi:ribosomal-protein-serine acetyltransferase